MKKEQNQIDDQDKSNENDLKLKDNFKEENQINKEDESKELTPEEKVIELEDKLTKLLQKWKTKEEGLKKKKEDAFDYGGLALQRRP